jgi:hypothetical protein
MIIDKLQNSSVRKLFSSPILVQLHILAITMCVPVNPLGGSKAPFLEYLIWSAFELLKTKRAKGCCQSWQLCRGLKLDFRSVAVAIFLSNLKNLTLGENELSGMPFSG